MSTRGLFHTETLNVAEGHGGILEGKDTTCNGFVCQEKCWQSGRNVYNSIYSQTSFIRTTWYLLKCVLIKNYEKCRLLNNYK